MREKREVKREEVKDWLDESFGRTRKPLQKILSLVYASFKHPAMEVSLGGDMNELLLISCLGMEAKW